MKHLAPMILSVLLIGAAPLWAQDIRTERVQFARGATSAVVEGSIKGFETVDYVLGAKKGQYMNVGMATDNTGNYFNILAPGESEVAMFNGSTAENQYEGTLPASGDYKVRVYLMRSAARRGEIARYRLEVAITGPAHGNGASAGTGDAKVPGTDFNATGEVPCARVAGQPMHQCRFGVVRQGGGSGWITVFWPDGGNRVIYFENGAPSRYDESEADGGAKLSVQREVDLFMVRIGDQRFEIPEAALVGG